MSLWAAGGFDMSLAMLHLIAPNQPDPFRGPDLPSAQF